MLFAPACAAAQDSSYKDVELKAAFLVNLLKFVEWPSGSFSDSRAPFVLCVIEDDRTSFELERLAANKSVAGHPLKIRAIDRRRPIRGCQALLIGDVKDKDILPLLQSVEGGAVLTIGGADQFLAVGGSVRFFLQGDQIRFTINAPAIARDHLAVSSQLMRWSQVTVHPLRDGVN